MPISDSRIVWLDMEMTGLDPSRCVPLQVAVVITDADLLELDAVELTIWQPESSLSTIEPFVQKMHTDNGLLAKVRRSDTSLATAERAMMDVLVKWCPYQAGVLAGNSIHVDRTFLKAFFPVFEGYLHYRMIDVSSIKELVRRWYSSDRAFGKGTGTHTALQDVRESIAELAHYRQKVFQAR
ncbi:MAG: oligoribonuclease [Deltaproteobacteria bacterium]|nr:oligoribonuclease [Deltaproteobacteria bacterium]